MLSVSIDAIATLRSELRRGATCSKRRQWRPLALLTIILGEARRRGRKHTHTYKQALLTEAWSLSASSGLNKLPTATGRLAVVPLNYRAGSWRGFLGMGLGLHVFTVPRQDYRLAAVLCACRIIRGWFINSDGQ
eukprot:2685573-Amphidinium_carterae.1